MDSVSVPTLEMGRLMWFVDIVVWAIALLIGFAVIGLPICLILYAVLLFFAKR